MKKWQFLKEERKVSSRELTTMFAGREDRGEVVGGRVRPLVDVKLIFEMEEQT